MWIIHRNSKTWNSSMTAVELKKKKKTDADNEAEKSEYMKVKFYKLRTA